MDFTVWYNLVHDSEEKAPFSQAVPAQALPWCHQLLKLGVWGQHPWNVLIQITPKKTPVHFTQHTSWEWTLPALVYIKKRVCHGFSIKLNSESPRLQCSACKSITPDQVQCWNVMVGTALQYPSWTGTWSNRAACVMKLKNQSMVTCYFCVGKRGTYKVIVEESWTEAWGENSHYSKISDIPLWGKALSTKEESMFYENGHKYCFYNPQRMKSKAIWSLHLLLKQTLQELWNSLIPTHPLTMH